MGHRVTPAQARRRIESLRSQIRHHDYCYYALDRPTISDAAYDGLMRQAQQLEALFPELVTPDSPTQRVAGEAREGFRTIAHHAPMLSLDSTTDAGAVRQFDARMHDAIGVKFAARSATTRLERIEVQVGRTGVLTPVAVLRPVEIGGVTVTRATLHNWHELARRELRIGDIVEVARAGDVIPEVVGRVAGSRRLGAAPRPPARCPVCHARVVARGPFRLCPNTLGCAAQRVRAIQHFASRDAFDIDGLGPSTVEALVDAGLARTVADLFTLTDDDLRGLPRFGAAAANRLAAAIDAARRVELDRLLHALGIPAVGGATAASLAEQFKTLGAVRHATLAQLTATRGIGPAAGRAIAAFFRRPENQAVIDALLRHGVTVVPYQKGKGGARGAGTVVFTGTLHAMSRADAKRLVERHGGRPGDRVTRATDLVVAGSGPGSKLQRARELAVPVITEREFLRRYASRQREVPSRESPSHYLRSLRGEP